MRQAAVLDRPADTATMPDMTTDALARLMGNTGFPETVFLIYFPESGLHGCARTAAKEAGLAVFSSERRAQAFIPKCSQGEAASVVSMSFDDARDLAKAKGLPIVCMILADNPEKPLVHYVR